MSAPNIPVGDGQRYTPDATPRRGAPGFGTDANSVGMRTIDLGTARDLEEVNLTGTFLWAYNASDLDASIDVHFQDQSGRPVTFQKGLLIRGVRFDRLFISNTAQAGKYVTFMYLVERGEGGVSVENPLVAFQNVTLNKPDTLAGSGDQAVSTASTDTLAANAGRRELTVQADDGNTGPVYLRDSSGNAFAKLSPGDAVTVSVTDEMQVRNDSGATQTYRTMEVAD